MLNDMNAVSASQLHAVVQVEVDEEWSQIQLPKRPWPLYVRLWGNAEPEAVALVVGTLVTWGRESTQWFIEALANEFPAGVPGGFAVTDGERLIGPSCCCGLETWHEWLDALTTRQSPWMGHDPAPFVEFQEERVSIWADGDQGGSSRNGSPITFSASAFDTAVKQAARELSEFEEPLRRWLSVHAPRYEDNVAAQFRERFIVCASPEST